MESYRKTRRPRGELEVDLSRLKRYKAHRQAKNLGLGETIDEKQTISDCESSSGSSSAPRQVISPRIHKQVSVFESIGMVKLEDDENGNIVKKAFHTSAGMQQAEVVSVHKNMFLDASAQARLMSFQIFADAAKKKCPNEAGNIKYGWYHTSKDGVESVISHGFSHCGRPESNGGGFGFGVYLSRDSLSTESLMAVPSDEEGLRYVLLCRVIMGKVEEVHHGSTQSHPSSKIYDSGVDNLQSPKKYIVWSTHMNTHILPEYVVSFKAPPPPSFGGIQEPEVLSRSPVRQEPGVPPKSPVFPEPTAAPTSPWIAFPTLISILSEALPVHTIGLVKEYHREYQEKKVTRQQLIQNVRGVVGDQILMSVIQSYRAKQRTAAQLRSRSEMIQV